MSKDNDQQQQKQQMFACPPMEMDAASGERKRYVLVPSLPAICDLISRIPHLTNPTNAQHSTPVVSRYPRSAKVYTDSLEGLSPGGATLLAAVPRTNPDGTRVYTPVRRCVLPPCWIYMLRVCVTSRITRASGSQSLNSHTLHT